MGYEAFCDACDNYGPVNDMGICEECSAKLERDLIRNRDWEYAVLAYGLGEKDREALRRQVVKEHGEKLELIKPSPECDGFNPPGMR